MNTILVNLFDYTNLNKNSTPLGILSLATKLQNNRDFNVKVLDFHRIYESKILRLADSIDENIINTMNYILKFKPDVVGFYSLCSTHLFAIIIAKLIKSANENITIIFGGPQATLTAKETIEKFDFIDMVGLYEGETTIRLKSNKRILDEIVHYKNKYGVTEFEFVHDLFTLNKKRVVEICQMFIDNKLHITWKK